MSATISISTAIELEFDKIYTEIKFENINLTRALRLILENAEVRCIDAASSNYTTEAEAHKEDGYVSGQFDGYEDGYSDGQIFGEEEGYELGYSEKCQDKHEEGFTDGYDQGHMDGHLEGRDEGYKEGFEDRKEAK
jgi:flagellar biosynthesis/type III secretory pathway protein FliH